MWTDKYILECDKFLANKISDYKSIVSMVITLDISSFNIPLCVSVQPNVKAAEDPRNRDCGIGGSS